MAKGLKPRTLVETLDQKVLSEEEREEFIRSLITHDVRYKIICLLAKHGAMNSGRLFKILAEKAPELIPKKGKPFRHIADLIDSGLITTQRAGREAIYEINRGMIERFLQTLQTDFPEPSTAALKPKKQKFLNSQDLKRALFTLAQRDNYTSIRALYSHPAILTAQEIIKITKASYNHVNNALIESWLAGFLNREILRHNSYR